MGFESGFRLGQAIRGAISRNKRENELERRKIKLLEDRLSLDIEKAQHQAGLDMEKLRQEEESLARRREAGSAVSLLQDPSFELDDISRSQLESIARQKLFQEEQFEGGLAQPLGEKQRLADPLTGRFIGPPAAGSGESSPEQQLQEILEEDEGTEQREEAPAVEEEEPEDFTSMRRGGVVTPETATREDFKLADINRQYDLALSQGRPREVLDELDRQREALQSQREQPTPAKPSMATVFDAEIDRVARQIRQALRLPQTPLINRTVDNLQAQLNALRDRRNDVLMREKRPAEQRLKVRGSIRQEPAFKDFNASRAAFNSILRGVEAGSNFGDLAIINGLARMLDPGSVVRPSEFETVRAARAFMARLGSLEAKVLRGEQLTDRERAQILALANGIMEEYVRVAQDDIVQVFGPISDTFGFDVRSVMGDMRLPPIDKARRALARRQRVDEDKVIPAD